MSSMYDQFKTDPELEKEGTWINYGLYQIRLARAGGANKDYQKDIERRARPVRALARNDALENAQVTDMQRRAFAKTVIKGWQIRESEDAPWVDGIENPDGGEPLPVNRDNILATFVALPALFDDLLGQAQSIANYRATLREEAGKNS